MECISQNIGPYKIHFLKTKKFKTITIDVNFLREVTREDITYQNLLTYVLSRSTKAYNTRQKLLNASNELYDIGVFLNSKRIGNSINFKVRTSFLNPHYTEETMLEESIKYAFNLIFYPNCENNAFIQKEYKKSVDLFTNNLESLKENTSKYALIKALESFDDKSIVSLNSYGYLEDLEKIDETKLYEYYLNMLKHDKIDIYVLGDYDIDEVSNLIKKYFLVNTIKRTKIVVDVLETKSRQRIKKSYLELELSQSKLAIIGQLLGLDKYEKQYVLPILNYILGASPSSKLFQEVREKNSLAYSISSSIQRNDNLFYITAGIATENFEKTLKIIKKCLTELINGVVSLDMIKMAQNSFTEDLKTIEDNPSLILSYQYIQELYNYDSLDVRIKNIKKVSLEDITKLSHKMSLNTAFLLKGTK